MDNNKIARLFRALDVTVDDDGNIDYDSFTYRLRRMEDDLKNQFIALDANLCDILFDANALKAKADFRKDVEMSKKAQEYIDKIHLIMESTK